MLSCEIVRSNLGKIALWLVLGLGFVVEVCRSTRLLLHVRNSKSTHRPRLQHWKHSE